MAVTPAREMINHLNVMIAALEADEDSAFRMAHGNFETLRMGYPELMHEEELRDALLEYKSNYDYIKTLPCGTQDMMGAGEALINAELNDRTA